jgi:hypothetical protein
MRIAQFSGGHGNTVTPIVFFQKQNLKKSLLSLQGSALLLDSLIPTERSCSGQR